MSSLDSYPSSHGSVENGPPPLGDKPVIFRLGPPLSTDYGRKGKHLSTRLDQPLIPGCLTFQNVKPNLSGPSSLKKYTNLSEVWRSHSKTIGAVDQNLCLLYWLYYNTKL